MRPRTFAILAVTTLALSVALMFLVDARLATWLHEQGLPAALRRKGTALRALSEFLKQTGEWYIALLAALIVTFAPLRNRLTLSPTLESPAPAAGGTPSGTAPGWKLNWPAGLFIALSVLAASSNALVKWISGRERPFRDGQLIPDALTFSPFRGGLTGLFNQTNLSLPSGHATSAFALATALCCLYPRLYPLFLLAAAATATERVLTNSHYPSDALLGALLGSACALLLFHLTKAYSTRYSSTGSAPPLHTHSKIPNS